MSTVVDDKPVSQVQVFNIIILALRELKKRYAFDANMLELGFDHACNTEAYQKVREVETAIAFIQQLRKVKA